MSLEGGCRCGGVRYELASDDLPLTYACHCLDCQTWSGSAFALHAIVAQNALSIEGSVHDFRLPEGQEARPSDHIGCAVCLTRIVNRNEALPNMLVLRVGTLDRSRDVSPAVHIWTRQKQEWLTIDDSTPTFEVSPTPAEFAAALSG
ncbi:aldehyde-activating protein [Sphingobium sp. SCG-1]|uniref:GFA family protein n=1 Tax=Sphingobium sp. SCG-1 TaxID=2072936 RepID=UPI000CD69DDE|nr:GFA family protein [Sphingobium sp. SCG-1]AUW57827.1 aldehyde-activating protein [Sphingobium sp. SCG-1]